MIGFLLTLLYGAGFLALGLYALRMVALTLAWHLLARRGSDKDGDELELTRAVGDPPFVTVQLPIYNEPRVAARAIDAACRLNWPAERIEVQVLDDSSDATREIVDQSAAAWRERGRSVTVLRRDERKGYKGGALAAGTEQAKGEFLAVFDADFAPRPDFLEQAMAGFAPGIGVVQARWSHLNGDESRLTRAQALALDGYFIVEQSALSGLGLFMNFNGTAGVWRRQTLDDAGGWCGDTLSEDIDLSYRAQLAGWRIRFLPELDAPAELPADIRALKRQQKRWSKGTIQVLRKLAGRIALAPIPWWRKLVAYVNLGRHLTHPLLMLMLLVSPSLLVQPLQLPAGFALLWLVPFCPPLLFASALWRLDGGRPGLRRLRRYPYLALLTIGLTANNARAVLEALAGRESPFERTPKRGDVQARPELGRLRSRALRRPELEAWLCAYAALVCVLALASGLAGLALFAALFAAGFGLTAWLAAFDSSLALSDLEPALDLHRLP